MYSMENRMNLNAVIFKNAVGLSDSLYGRFTEIGKKYREFKNICLKLKFKKNRLEKLEEIKKRFMMLLIKERELWELMMKNDQSVDF